MGEELCFTFQSVVSTKTHLVKYVEVSFILVLTYNTGLENMYMKLTLIFLILHQFIVKRNLTTHKHTNLLHFSS